MSTQSHCLLQVVWCKASARDMLCFRGHPKFNPCEPFCRFCCVLNNEGPKISIQIYDAHILGELAATQHHLPPALKVRVTYPVPPIPVETTSVAMLARIRSQKLVPVVWRVRLLADEVASAPFEVGRCLKALAHLGRILARQPGRIDKRQLLDCTKTSFLHRTAVRRGAFLRPRVANKRGQKRRAKVRKACVVFFE